MTKPLSIGLRMVGSENWTGGTEYIQNLVRTLGHFKATAPRTVHVSLVAREPLTLDKSISPFVHNVVLEKELFQRKSSTSSFFQRVLRPEWLPKSSRLREKLFPQPFDFLFPQFPLPFVAGKAFASCLFDFQFKHYPSFFSKEALQSLENAFGEICRRSPMIVVNSENARSDLAKFYPEGLPRAKVLRFYTFPQEQWFTGSKAEIVQKYHLPPKFFFACNQFWVHKNHLTIFKALKRLKDRGTTAYLVCTGHMYDPRNPDYLNRLLDFIHTNDLRENILFLGCIPKDDQMTIMRHSLSVVQPSLFEGWSTVVENARIFGKHLILSDIQVHKEQDPEGAWYFEPQNDSQLADLLTRAWANAPQAEDPQAREKALKRSLDFGQTFLSLIEEALSSIRS